MVPTHQQWIRYSDKFRRVQNGYCEVLEHGLFKNMGIQMLKLSWSPVFCLGALDAGIGHHIPWRTGSEEVQQLTASGFSETTGFQFSEGACGWTYIITSHMFIGCLRGRGSWGVNISSYCFQKC